ncbi:hypothetical protein F5884DRAFT_858140 [Xylogone sp. PMI_703]|nr:hypothetical protein F5884DRAFT_858140 [Xylogone sp. PMI_703]
MGKRKIKDYYTIAEKPATRVTGARVLRNGKKLNIAIISSKSKASNQVRTTTNSQDTSTGIETLPIEVHQTIIDFLQEDKDVVSYAKVCKATCRAVSSSVWYARFTTTFDPAKGDVQDLAAKYTLRQGVANQCVLFGPRIRVAMQSLRQSNKKMKPVVIKMLKDLILESDARTTPNSINIPLVDGKNFKWLCQYLNCDAPSAICTDIIDVTLSDDDNNNFAELLIIQICLASLSLNRFYHASNKLVGFDESQRMVYAHQDGEPLFSGRYSSVVNARWVLHALNFFKFHMRAQDGEGVLNAEYESYDDWMLPQFWTGKLVNGTQKLGRRWLGAYTFLEYPDLMKIRRPSHRNDIFMDEIDSECPTSYLRIWFDEEFFGQKEWPKAWEQFLHSPLHGYSRRTTRNISKCPEVKHFFGRAEDSRISNFYGCIHEIPPQQGIPGFQRIAMLKFFPDANGIYDPEQVWGYEGVVLPGNRIIVGRWWDIYNVTSSYCGPFIFWNIFSPLDETTEGKEEVISFFDSVNAISFTD